MLAACLLCTASLLAQPADGNGRTLPPGVERVLELPPGDNNPRNSEGDFIVLRDGSILFVYTHFVGGGGDHDSAHLAGRRSKDGGETWSSEDELVVANEGGMNVMSVSLLRLADGRIALFYLRKNATDDCRPYVRFSDDEALTWSAPRLCIEAPVGYYVVNNDRVIQLKSGRLVMPASLHALQGEPFGPGRAMAWLSDDAGKTWHQSQTTLTAPESVRSGLQEPGVIELLDGRLLLLARTSAGMHFRSYSSDAGETWTPAEPTDLLSPCSPATFERLPGRDDILMVWNDHRGMDPALAGKRTPLSLALSKDDGLTWDRVANLETDPNGWYCYTAMAFTGTHILLGQCAGDRSTNNGLAQTQVLCLPLDWPCASKPR